MFSVSVKVTMHRIVLHATLGPGGGVAGIARNLGVADPPVTGV